MTIDGTVLLMLYRLLAEYQEEVLTLQAKLQAADMQIQHLPPPGPAIPRRSQGIQTLAGIAEEARRPGGVQ